jgi:hypothetical protein
MNKILKKIPNDPSITIVNIASDAEIIPIPSRLNYGKLKRESRLLLESRKNRVVNIFFPYVTQKNWLELFYKLSRIDYKRNFYYLSPLSNLIKPITFKVEPTIIHTHINWKDSRYCIRENGFKSQLVQNKGLYETIRVLVEDAYSLDMVPHDDLHVGFLSWQLAFDGPKPLGKKHTDMKRCLFGNLFRALLCIENTTDYKITIGDQVYTMAQNDIIVIPGGIKHQPLSTTQGARKIIVLDYFTTSTPDFIRIFMFYVFNSLKILGIEV